MKKKLAKLTIGSEEWCAFPDMALPAIKARVDSGAKTSSIHAFNIQPFRRDGQAWVSFEVHPIQKNRRIVIRCEKPVIDKRSVKNTSGLAETRYVVSAPMKLGKEVWEVELTLANRDSMGYRMLLGREAMKDRAIIDPALRFVQGKFTSKRIDDLYGQQVRHQSGLKIALLGSNEDLYSNQRILEAGEERGHEMIFLDVRQCYMKMDPRAPEAHYRGQRLDEGIRAIIPRIRPSMTLYGCALVRQFESMKIHTINSSQSIAHSRDRLYAMHLMLQHGIKIPTTAFASSPLDNGDLIDMVGGAPLTIKLLDASRSRGVILAETRKAAESVINTFKSLDASLLIQQYIEEGAAQFLRCFVIRGSVIAASQRTSAEGNNHPDLGRAGNLVPTKLSADERKLAITATRLLGLTCAGIDMIRSGDGPLLLEVNPSPGLEGLEAATGKDIAGQMIASIEKKLGWKRELANPVT